MTRAKTFPRVERQILLAVKGEGPTVVARPEPIGITALAEPAGRSPEGVCAEGTGLTGSASWMNSPQARKANSAANEAAQSNSRAKA